MGKFRKRLLVLVSIIVSVTFLLTGCGSSSKTSTTSNSGSGSSSSSGNKPVNITFSWWTNPTRTKLTKQAVALFEKKYPNIHVTMEYSSWNGYWQKLATEAAGGSIPDVMQMDGSKIAQYTSNGQLMDLSKTNVDTSGLNPSTVDLGKVNGTLYALTNSINAQLLIDNPAILKQAGVTFPTSNYTWADFAQLCETIYQKTGVYGTPDEMEQPAFLDYWARTYGQNLYSADGKKIGMTKKTLTAWFQYWLDMQAKGGVPTAQINASYDHNDHSASPFIKGKTAFNWLFLGTGGEFEKDLGKPINRVLLPEWGKSNKPYPLHPAMYWAMSSKTKNPDAAAKLINFIENDPSVAKIFQNDRGIPANVKNMKLVQQTTTDPTVKKQNSFMAKVEKVATPTNLAPANSSKTSDILKNLAQEVSFKKITPSQAADQFIQQVNQELSQ